MQIFTVKEYEKIDRFYFHNEKPEIFDLDNSEKLYRKLEQIVISFNENLINENVSDIIKVGKDSIQFKNYIGVIPLNKNVQIEILPKILIENDPHDEELRKIFLRMLRKCSNLNEKHLMMSNLSTAHLPIYEIFIEMYFQEAYQLMKNGLKYDYLIKQENLPYFKGKLLITEQIKHNAAHQERFFCEFDDYHINRPENKLIKAAIEKLLKISSSSKNKRLGKEILVLMSDVETSTNYNSDFSKVVLDKSMKKYERILEWTRIFLDNLSFSTFSGDKEAFALLFPMQKLFEKYLYVELKRSLYEKNVIYQGKGYRRYLFTQNDIEKFRLDPDISIYDNDEKLEFILDAKWKLLNTTNGKNNYNISQADMYQMYAYGKMYKCKDIFLCYPKTSTVNKQIQDYISNDANDDEKVTIHIEFVDLEKMDDWLKDMKSLLIKN